MSKIDDIELLIDKGINYLDFQIDVLYTKNERLGDINCIDWINKNVSLIAVEKIEKMLKDNYIKEKAENLLNIFDEVKKYMYESTRTMPGFKTEWQKHIKDVFYDYEDMLSNNLDYNDLKETFEGWCEDGNLYLERADEDFISHQYANICINLMNKFSPELNKFTNQIANILDEIIEIEENKNKCLDVFRESYKEDKTYNGMIPANSVLIENYTNEIKELIDEGRLQVRDCEGLAYELTESEIGNIKEIESKENEEEEYE